MKTKIAVLTGAGVSAESGLNTFRDSNGLWEGHDVMEVASLEGYYRNPELVLNFYNQRRRQLHKVRPNEAHLALVKLETSFNVTIITQNVDDLHERAGSSAVVHLHGELLKVRSTANEQLTLAWDGDLVLGDKCPQGHQLRPHIVWFGELVPMLEEAARIVNMADIIIIIGTSMQVYPAASLVHYAANKVPIYFIDPRPNVSLNDFDNLTIVAKTAVEGVPTLVDTLLHSMA